MRRISGYVLVLLAALLLAGCAGGPDPHTVELLNTDYAAMSDAELQVYHQQLGDQLGREARADRLAQGTGLFKVDRTEEEAAAADLRQRWNEVRQELRRRALLP